MSLAAKVQEKKYWTFVIVGDGCLNEGQSWEAIMAAAKFKPERFVIMVDYNRVQLDGPAIEIMPLDPLMDKFKAFNLNVIEKVYDGHSVADIMESWDWIQANQSAPVVVIYKTNKGKGVSFMEDQSKWHGAPIDMESWDKGRVELVSHLNEIEI
jgi:transketolase